jgi:hypothetical protein
MMWWVFHYSLREFAKIDVVQLYNRFEATFTFTRLVEVSRGFHLDVQVLTDVG